MKMNIIFFVVWFLFYGPSTFHSEMILQMDEVIMAQEGEDVSLHCFHPKEQINRVLWYKQTLGEKPALLVSSYHWTVDSVIHEEFKNTNRFKAARGIGSFNLTILRTVKSDSATYFCAGSFANVVYFGTGTNLMLRGSNVTLQCAIQNEKESCGGKHNVYWFRHGSQKSHPGIIYTQGGRGDRGENSSVDGSARSCVYTLPMNNISPSDAGTYYCAVVVCGEILFGRGINLTIDDEPKIQRIQLYILIGLALPLTISFIINVLLCVTMVKGKSSQVQATADVMSSAQYHVASDVNYAALKLTTKSSRQQRERSQNETEYSGRMF
ncbi:novel immune-type receptor 4a [Xyrauchen texanus]|uniref:novel immune-type receptor 4a n=1 Tax=Xyrauchen texanus TaxID=154827 RepID=UPI002241C465|nr:novel immune-type receptor 4a [Xyrauchen texanus]